MPLYNKHVYTVNYTASMSIYTYLLLEMAYRPIGNRLDEVFGVAFSCTPSELFGEKVYSCPWTSAKLWAWKRETKSYGMK